MIEASSKAYSLIGPNPNKHIETPTQYQFFRTSQMSHVNHCDC